MPKKRTSLDELFNDKSQTENSTSALQAEVPNKATDIKRQTVYLPEAVYEQIRTLAFQERRKMHDYLLEGLDFVFKSRGLKSLDELTRK